MRYRPDAFDLAILDLLQADAALSHREIGERVNLSAAAVHRRVRRLEAEGVILGTVAIVDPACLGRPITIVAEVHVESERLDLLDEVKRRFRDCPDVQQCYYVTGEADFVLVLTVASMGHYDALARELFFADANVRRFRTLVVMDRVKARLATPAIAPE
jgi:Lrp/AsnC family leucine-responsive transcriptional regulator